MVTSPTMTGGLKSEKILSFTVCYAIVFSVRLLRNRTE